MHGARGRQKALPCTFRTDRRRFRRQPVGSPTSPSRNEDGSDRRPSSATSSLYSDDAQATRRATVKAGITGTQSVVDCRSVHGSRSCSARTPNPSHFVVQQHSVRGSDRADGPADHRVRRRGSHRWRTENFSSSSFLHQDGTCSLFRKGVATPNPSHSADPVPRRRVQTAGNLNPKSVADVRNEPQIRRR